MRGGAEPLQHSYVNSIRFGQGRTRDRGEDAIEYRPSAANACSQPVHGNLQIGGAVGIRRRHAAAAHVDLHRRQHQRRQSQRGVASLAARNEYRLEYAVAHMDVVSALLCDRGDAGCLAVRG